MKIQNINLSMPRKELFGGKEYLTGINKKPVTGPQNLGLSGFDNDGVADLKNHGGADKAVCVYSLDHYPYWEEKLGRTLPPPAFGENLSVQDLDEKDICLGDIFRMGAALVQVSQPRQPCKTLAARFGRSDLPKLVAQTGRTGMYFRVLEEGTVTPGDILKLVEQSPGRISVAFANQIFYHDRKNQQGIEMILSVAALSTSWRTSFEELREKTR